MKLILDKRSGNRNKDIVYDNPSVNQMVECLGRLDGHQHTLLSVEREDGWQLNIGGGPDWFVVTASSDKENLTLLNLGANDAQPVELCAGGQFSDYPASIVVDKRMAEKAIVSFFEREENELDWEKEDSY